MVIVRAEKREVISDGESDAEVSDRTLGMFSKLM